MTSRPLLAAGLLLTTAGAAQAHSFPTLEAIESAFGQAQVVSGPEFVECTLSGGTQTTCFAITVRPEPANRTPGPWCPRNVSDGPDVSGIWLENGTVHDADGDFMSNLPTFYDDETWQMVDPETGDIKVTETAEQCQAAARPDVGPEYQNYCVECRTDDVVMEDQTTTFVIPLEAVAVEGGSGPRFGLSGVAFDGIRLDAPAPVDAILGAYTIAPFDDCGGHVNPFEGYHYHAVTDCQQEVGADVETPTPLDAAPIGIAMDGYLILSHLRPDGTAPEGLDACYGHDTAEAGYHYHAGAPGGNQIVGCLAAEYGCALDDPEGTCDASLPPRRP